MILRINDGETVVFYEVTEAEVTDKEFIFNTDKDTQWTYELKGASFALFDGGQLLYEKQFIRCEEHVTKKVMGQVSTRYCQKSFDHEGKHSWEENNNE